MMHTPAPDTLSPPYLFERTNCPENNGIPAWESAIIGLS